MRSSRRGHLSPRTLSRFIDGELPDATRRHVEDHVSVCPGCRRMLRSLARTVQALGALERERADGRADRIIAILRRPERAPDRSAPGSRMRRAARYCVAGGRLRLTLPAALALGVALSLVNQGGHLLAGHVDIGMCAMCGANLLLPFVALNVLLALTAARHARRDP